VVFNAFIKCKRQGRHLANGYSGNNRSNVNSVKYELRNNVAVNWGDGIMSEASVGWNILCGAMAKIR